MTPISLVSVSIKVLCSIYFSQEKNTNFSS
nr:MAG TPA: hypothetical protein [Bacteriophage sp.]